MVVSAGKPDGILTGRSLVDLALSSLFLLPSLVLLSRKRVESASHILENCWGHLTSWQNTFPRIGGTWPRVYLYEQPSLDPSPSRSHLLHLSRVLSLPRLFIVLFVSVSLFFFSDALSLSLFLFLNRPLYRGNNPRCISRPRGADGYCFARADVGPYFFPFLPPLS